MVLKTLLNGKTYLFNNLAEVLAKANDEKSGDVLLGRAAQTVSERTAAKIVLANLTIAAVTSVMAGAGFNDEVQHL